MKELSVDMFIVVVGLVVSENDMQMSTPFELTKSVKGLIKVV